MSVMSDLDIELMTIATNEINAGTPDSEIKNILRQSIGPGHMGKERWVEDQINAVMSRANRHQ